MIDYCPSVVKLVLHHNILTILSITANPLLEEIRANSQALIPFPICEKCVQLIHERKEVSSEFIRLHGICGPTVIMRNTGLLSAVVLSVLSRTCSSFIQIAYGCQIMHAGAPTAAQVQWCHPTFRIWPHKWSLTWPLSQSEVEEATDGRWEQGRGREWSWFDELSGIPAGLGRGSRDSICGA